MMRAMDGEVQPEPRVDLHVHSLHSDGTLAPAALVQLAAGRGLSLLALTDHDTTAGCAEAGAACRAHGITFTPGAEFTTLWRSLEVHVVGLRLDCGSASLQAHLAAVRERRVARLTAMGGKLDALGLPGSELVAQILAGPGTPTRLHLARLLVERGLVPEVDAAFERWLRRGRPAAVAPEWPELAAGVAAIRGADGVAVLAHPHRYTLSAGQLRELCAQFRDCGGQALEVSVSGMGPGQQGRAAALARRFGLAGSWASDFHVPGIPWRPLGRFAKLPEGVAPVTALLGFPPRNDGQQG
jgi:predicted metal-dependent phosphoesterase TrpH